MNATVLLMLCAVVEACTGLGLVLLPQLLVKLLLNAEIAGTGLIISRVCGFGLLSLGVTCWPGVQALHGILLYNVAVTAYLTYLMVGGEYRCTLLVPVVILHSVLTVLLLWRSYRVRLGNFRGEHIREGR